ncbi:MAG TPA: ATP-binding protein [Terriglobia bacterium]
MERQRLLREVEQQRRRQAELKDEFLSHVSHELRSPLTAIYQFTTLVLDGLAGDLNLQQREYLGIALRNVQQLRTMIEDILIVTRAEVGKLQIEPRALGLSELIHQTLDALRVQAAERNVALETQISPDLPSVYADPTRTRQVLSNLIENGIKYAGEGARISVKAGISGEEPQFVRVAVIDNGPGLSREQAACVFDRLYQAGDPASAGRKGLGLGLFISKQLVQAHGGRIGLESEPGRGCSFFFTLPVLSLAQLLVLSDVSRRNIS